MRLFGNFNTIKKVYSLFNNNVYYVKYDELDSIEKKYSSLHFTPFLAHEAFHYYMQNNWELLSPPLTELSNNDKELLKQEYNILSNIQNEFLANTYDRNKLLEYATKYTDIVAKRINNNKDYLTAELTKETDEGTAQYVGIKASRIVNYDYGVMYFDNIKNVPFSDIFIQLEQGNINIDYLYSRILMKVELNYDFYVMP